VLALASHTGWACSEILSMSTSRFIFWLEGLPKDAHGK
jgi:hypothetical protein